MFNQSGLATQQLLRLILILDLQHLLSLANLRIQLRADQLIHFVGDKTRECGFTHRRCTHIGQLSILPTQAEIPVQKRIHACPGVHIRGVYMAADLCEHLLTSPFLLSSQSLTGYGQQVLLLGYRVVSAGI